MLRIIPQFLSSIVVIVLGLSPAVLATSFPTDVFYGGSFCLTCDKPIYNPVAGTVAVQCKDTSGHYQSNTLQLGVSDEQCGNKQDSAPCIIFNGTIKSCSKNAPYQSLNNYPCNKAPTQSSLVFWFDAHNTNGSLTEFSSCGAPYTSPKPNPTPLPYGKATAPYYFAGNACAQGNGAGCVLTNLVTTKDQIKASYNCQDSQGKWSLQPNNVIRILLGKQPVMQLFALGKLASTTPCTEISSTSGLTTCPASSALPSTIVDPGYYAAGLSNNNASMGVSSCNVLTPPAPPNSAQYLCYGTMQAINTPVVGYQTCWRENRLPRPVLCTVQSVCPATLQLSRSIRIPVCNPGSPVTINGGGSGQTQGQIELTPSMSKEAAMQQANCTLPF